MAIFSIVKDALQKYLKPLRDRWTQNTSEENDALYRLIYLYVHDNDQSISLAALQRQDAFAKQWENLPEGDGLLSEPWFRENTSRILYEEELQISSEWFKGKEVLDAGCGNGRWSYGFAQLDANITAVDINQAALNKTRDVLEEFTIEKTFIQSPLEQLTDHLDSKKFDLVFSWGVVHHCESFNKSLNELTNCVKEGGMISYIYIAAKASLTKKISNSSNKESSITPYLPMKRSSNSLQKKLVVRPQKYINAMICMPPSSIEESSLII